MNSRRAKSLSLESLLQVDRKIDYLEEKLKGKIEVLTGFADTEVSMMMNVRKEYAC
jgi:hypothetical protein